MNEKEMLLKAIEIFGSKRQIANKLGYRGCISSINRVLNGKGHLPKWRFERLKLLLKRHQTKDCFTCPSLTRDKRTHLLNFCIVKNKQLSIKELRKACKDHPR